MILIADALHPVLLERLTAEKIAFNYQPEITREETLRIITPYTGLIVRSKFRVDKQFIDEARCLTFIARAGSGLDTIDTAYAQSRGIALLHAPEGLRDSVAEHTIGLMLSLHHHIVASHNEIQSALWDREGNRGTELGGKTVGIIGYGNTGSSVARKLSGFGVKVIAYDKYRENFADEYATPCDMETIYHQTDILTVHVPLTTETNGWMNETFFDRFRKPIVFINCARGKIVNPFDLVMALEKKKIAGAGLDVLPEEPPFSAGTDETPSWFHALRAMPNVIFTPHIAGWSTESYQRISEVLADKITVFYRSGQFG